MNPSKQTLSLKGWPLCSTHGSDGIAILRPLILWKFYEQILVASLLSLMISVSNTSRFVTLDAYRGVAAVIVVLFHAGIQFETYVPRFGYLAVDLFFLLSGFVLSRAYDHSLAEEMGIFEFFIFA
jgi:hypothetical protein